MAISWTMTDGNVRDSPLDRSVWDSPTLPSLEASNEALSLREAADDALTTAIGVWQHEAWAGKHEEAVVLVDRRPPRLRAQELRDGHVALNEDEIVWVALEHRTPVGSRVEEVEVLREQLGGIGRLEAAVDAHLHASIGL